MSDDKPRPADETQPVRPDSGSTLPTAPAAEPAPAAAYVAEPVPVVRRGFRERLGSLRRSDDDRGFGLAALIASALAGIIVGGLGFAAVHAISDDGGRDRGGFSQQHDGDEGPGGRGGMRGRPPGMPGQVQPTTPPDDDGSTG